jgi:tyrosinase
MATMDALVPGAAPGVLIANLAYARRPEVARFTRADLVFAGVDHGGLTYEVRVFLNAPAATGATPRDPSQGYAGRFVIFGHGGCFGELGHCDVPSIRRDPTDLRPGHPLVPQTKIVTITTALGRLLDKQRPLASITLVPWVYNGFRARNGCKPGVFKMTELTLRTYG